MNQKSNKLKNISPKSLLLIFAVLAALILTYSIVELIQSKKEMTLLMQEQSHSLLESILSASNSALLSYEIIDKEMKSRLLNNANLVKLLLEQNKVKNSLLEQIAHENNIHRINIFNNKGVKIFTSHQPTHTGLVEKFSPKDFLIPIFDGISDTLFLGVKEARYEDGYRFAVALASKNRSAIVLNLDADELLNFRRIIGFGALLKNVTGNKGIVYTVLEDTSGIIAASGNITIIGNINNDPFLYNALADSSFASRTIETDSLNIFETVHAFSYKDEIVGLLRLGLPADPLIRMTERNETRILIMGLILFVLGSILLAYVFTKQNFDLLKKDYKIIEDYSQKVIQNVSDCVIVIDKDLEIQTFNTAAESLFNKRKDSVISQKLYLLLDEKTVNLILSSNSFLEHIETQISGSKKYLLISKSEFAVEENKINTILVIRDLTKQKVIEEQMNRKERMVAMGELASGVAHEIRNPLNTISTITQQLNKDFQPKSNEEEFYTLSNLVAKEINRINETINSFLRFSKPEKIILNEFMLSDLLDQIETQYRSMLNDKSIQLILEKNWNGKVNWDRNQIQQVIMNLVQNAFDAIKEDGEVILKVDPYSNNQVILKIRDNGIGIPEHILNKIFNLYFTTKAKGTGIGLSLVQRIIIEHGGTISVDSIEGKITTFSLILPINNSNNLR